MSKISKKSRNKLKNYFTTIGEIKVLKSQNLEPVNKSLNKKALKTLKNIMKLKTKKEIIQNKETWKLEVPLKSSNLLNFSENPKLKYKSVEKRSESKPSNLEYESSSDSIEYPDVNNCLREQRKGKTKIRTEERFLNKVVNKVLRDKTLNSELAFEKHELDP